MRIIIAGDGETGTYLAGALSIENQDVVLIGSDSAHLARLDATGNFITVEGIATSASLLQRCGISEAALFVAVTPDENLNIIASQLAKAMGAGRCVARVDSQEYVGERFAAVQRAAGVDSMIYPEQLAAGEICRFISHNWVMEWFEAHSGAIIVAGVRVARNAPLSGKMLKEMSVTPRMFHVSAIRRGSDIVIPRGDTRILPSDIVYFTVLPENVDHLRHLCGAVATPVRRIMISGAGEVTANLLERLSGKAIEVTVVEPDSGRCRVIASRFPKAVVVNARANDVDTLREEGIDRCDMFLALTGSSETNIVSCMVARQHGVAKTLARIEQLQYIPEAESLSIDKIINKKLINVGRIINEIMVSSDGQTSCMSLDMAEVVGLEAREGSRIVGRPVSEILLPRDITIGGLIRDGRGMLVEGRTVLRPGDHVMVFCVAGSLSKIEKLFR